MHRLSILAVSFGMVFMPPTHIHATENSSNSFKIVGTYIPSEVELDGEEGAAASEAIRSIDLSTAKIRIAYESPTGNGKTEMVEMASGRFSNGKVVFEGEIEQPTDVRISIVELEDQRKWVYTTITPGGEEINFAMVEDGDVRLALVGVSKRVKNPQYKFTISGDLRSIDKDMSRAHVLILDRDNAGSLKAISSGNMIPSEGLFLFEGEAPHPTVVQISVSTLRASGVSSAETYFGQTSAIVEPGAEILIHPQREHNELVATSGTGRHAQIIESWRQSSEYLELEDRLNVAETEFEDKRTTLWNAVNAAIKELNDFVGDESQPHLILEKELSELRAGKLQSIAKNAMDPLDSLLALEMGAFPPTSENRSEAFPIYDKLAELLDDEIVAQRVIPARDKLVSHIKSEENDADLVPGQKAPEFTLSNLNGTETSLYDVLADNELVLVEFWASWCGPCIASFPKLKELHSTYSTSGFEIVSISIDDDSYHWEQASEEQDLPWIDVGEMNGWDGDTATAYGVQFVPKGYLLDREGNILQKDLNPDELEEYLASKIK